MTREEAEKIVLRAHYPEDNPNLDPWCRRWVVQTVATFVELGMLKLEEPKSAYKRAYDLLDDQSYHAAQILELLTSNGLKIVEK